MYNQWDQTRGLTSNSRDLKHGLRGDVPAPQQQALKPPEELKRILFKAVNKAAQKQVKMGRNVILSPPKTLPSGEKIFELRSNEEGVKLRRKFKIILKMKPDGSIEVIEEPDGEELIDPKKDKQKPLNNRPKNKKAPKAGIKPPAPKNAALKLREPPYIPFMRQRVSFTPQSIQRTPGMYEVLKVVAAAGRSIGPTPENAPMLKATRPNLKLVSSRAALNSTGLGTGPR